MEGDLADISPIDGLLEATHSFERSRGLPVSGWQKTSSRPCYVERLAAFRASDDAFGERDRAARALGLGVGELAPHIRRNDADLARDEVDVAPAQAEQLALAQTGHRCGEVEGRARSPEGVVGRGDGEDLSSSGWSRNLIRVSVVLMTGRSASLTGLR